MDPLLARFFSPQAAHPLLSLYGHGPSSSFDAQVDWLETPQLHALKADLPGLKKDDINVQILEGNVLQISGERKKDDDKAAGTWHSLERPQGKFFRQFQLPDNVLVDHVKAYSEDGVLTITVSKKPISKPAARKIHISSKL